ncbi:DUF4232 domain-containing protein [Chelativorans sp.]|uniref:DUF4232 domain-containing protein n=1 Tax=Chelativorans sp. TaxID=2203393 RepID=UPI002811D762|nr:DUF4232 domain-containing protein [Chelativorans sp.]
MRISGLIPLLIVPLAVPLSLAAQAQSFDCAKADTDAEWAICNTPELAKLDEELAKTYRQLLDSAKEGSDFRKDVVQLQTSWVHGNRDLCRGDVSCLMDAYNTISAALPALSPDSPANPAQQPAYAIVPDCSAPADVPNNNLSVAAYNKTVCANRELLGKVRQIDGIARQLSSSLPTRWKAAFDAQQSAFAGTPNMCNPDEGPGLERCLAEAIEQRLEDVRNLAAHLEKPLPPCKSSELIIKDSDMGDGGMSQALGVYLLEHGGTDACALRGYPAISVLDGKGTEQPTYADYSGGTYFSNLPVPPLPVILSPTSRTAWFAIHTASACDPSSGPFKVKVALPHSQEWLRTLDFPNATCPQLTVTPIAAMSVLLSSIY